MTKYYKYLLALLLAVPVFTSAEAQKTVEVEVTRDVIFYCNKSTPIDLFKILGLYVSPESGYWGDENGLPLPDKNIFTFKETGKDSDTTYLFYFYITSTPPKANDYCGIKVGDRFKLNLGVHVINCRISLGAGSFDDNYYFCYGETQNIYDEYDIWNYGTTEINIGDLIFSKFAAANKKYMVDSTDMSKGWLPIEIYADSAHTMSKETGLTYSEKTVYTQSTQPQSTQQHYINEYQTNVDTLYLRILGQAQQQYQIYDAMIVIKVFRKSSIIVHYDPDIINNFMKEYEINDEINISVEDEQLFSVYQYYLNRRSLNERYAKGVDSLNTITLPVLAFSGVEDFIEIVAQDTNRCWAKYEEKVTVQVPMPTVFTPDGDGVNDVLFGGEKFRNREFHLEVFNRWANRIYYGESGWDGTYKGQPAPTGTYFYVITVRLSDGTKREFRSSVALIREE